MTSPPRKRGPTLRILIFAVLTCASLGVNSRADENDWFVYLGTKEAKQAPRKNINAAEALPPLPLPATPLRRTERKKPPQPDCLVGKVIWGQSASFVDTTGDKLEIADWNLCPTDAEKFVETARALDLQYHWQNTNLNSFHFDPEQLPALLFSGVRTLKLSDSHIQSLRDYVLSGGMIICDSIAGSPYFYDSAKKIFLRAFPESRFRVIAADHPLYHIIVDIDKVTCLGGKGQTEPFLEGIYVGSRVGVLVSKFGLGCGWNRNTERLKDLRDAAYYDVKSANDIGADLAAYIVGYAEVGLVEGRPEVFGLADQARPTDEFVFAQIKHDGLWNVHPGAATALLTKLRRYTSVRVNLKRVGVDVAQDDLSSYPFLYLTGLDDFSFSPQEISTLKQYLTSGGLLLINNGLGLGTFDAAVRREIKKVLPGITLEPVPAGHNLHRGIFDTSVVQYTPSLVKSKSELGGQPYLLGVMINGDLRVIYSPYDLEAGWLEVQYPQMRGYESISAQRLGMNIVIYMMTH
ncbi:MAG: hypothetical protein A2Z25_15795 [Planctomycetes bacterium RBG_16_55_9]|nr:MAG: hypothetical protein A2Z25_15795 [Planctomycetes bacterium RBG_16_55_9]